MSVFQLKTDEISRGYDPRLTVIDGQLAIARGRQVTPVARVDQLPLTIGGRVGFQIDNLLASVAACLIPARRATRVNPMSARAAPRDVDPRTVRYPNDIAIRAMISPSACSLIRTATPCPRW